MRQINGVTMIGTQKCVALCGLLVVLSGCAFFSNKRVHVDSGLVGATTVNGLLCEHQTFTNQLALLRLRGVAAKLTSLAYSGVTNMESVALDGFEVGDFCLYEITRTLEKTPYDIEEVQGKCEMLIYINEVIKDVSSRTRREELKTRLGAVAVASVWDGETHAYGSVSASADGNKLLLPSYFPSPNGWLVVENCTIDVRDAGRLCMETGAINEGLELESLSYHQDVKNGLHCFRMYMKAAREPLGGTAYFAVSRNIPVFGLAGGECSVASSSGVFQERTSIRLLNYGRLSPHVLSMLRKKGVAVLK